MQVSLAQGWTVEAVGGDVPAAYRGVSVPATVPGCVHLDLMAAGLIPDPYLDANAAECAWIGRVDWRYRTAFDWDGGPGHPGSGSPQVDLVTLGLDTVASVELNGTVVGQTANMHRSYRFDVAEKLRSGRNDLSVTFTGAVTAADAADALDHRLYLGALGNPHPFNAIRKMACNYGWDWGPDLATVGIWKPLYLETWSEVRIASVRPLVTVDGRTGILDAHVEVQRAPGTDAAISVEVQIAGNDVAVEVPAGRSHVEVQVEVADARLWWPHGYGDQPLYPVAVTATAGGGQHRWEGRVGFRTVELDTSPDEVGTPFTIRINGVAVFARGVNWIPDDCFPSRITRDRYEQRLTQAREAHVNMLRVWGGGLYESDDFYDLADEMGLLVWQDFLFACAAYSESEPLAGEVVAEAREAVTRLSPHPSLVLWNGCNENIWGYEDWDWKGPLAGKDWGLGYYLKVLPDIVAELDPTRPYCPGSPYSMSQDIHPNDPDHGTMHIWDVWNQRDYTAYRDYVPRFASEFGWQGPPTWATLTRAVHDEPLLPESAGMLFHQKAEGGNDKLTRGLEPHLPMPAEMPDWHWAMSLNQARAIAFGLEHFRSWMGTCMGTLVWQLNDCWPVTSWAAIDGDGRLKPLWYALRHAYADRLLTVQPRDGGLAVVAVNDTDEHWQGHLEIRRHAFDGTQLADATLELDVPARAAATVALPGGLATPADPAREALAVHASGAERACWFFAEDRDAHLPEPQSEVHLHQIDGGYRVTVTAQTLLRDLAVLADRLAPDAVVDDMLLTLLPGETAAFTITTTATLTPTQVADPLVLRCANQLVGTPASVGR